VWSPLEPDLFRPARISPTSIYDPRRDRLIVFGGNALYPEPDPTNDTWALAWGDPTKPSVACIDTLSPSGESVVTARYLLANPLPGERAIEWKVTSERSWPGFPRHGLLRVGGSAAETLAVELQIPDTAAAGSNVLRLTAAFNGAVGNDAWCEHVFVNPTTAVLASLISAEARDGTVRMQWQVATEAAVSVYRRGVSTAWSRLGEVRPDGQGRLTYEDHGVAAGERYGYRLGWNDGRGEVIAGETWVDVPRGSELALDGLRPNPAARDMAASFTLPAAGWVKLEFYDLTGRRVGRRQELDLDRGYHRVPASAWGPRAPGVYVLRLTFGRIRLQSRAVIVR